MEVYELGHRDGVSSNPGDGEIASRYYTGVKLARYIRRIPPVIALVTLLESLAMAALAMPLQSAPPGQAPGRPAATRARVRTPKTDNGKAPPLILTPSWTIDLPSSPFPGAAIDGGRGFVPLRSSKLVAIRLDGGATAWTASVDTVAGPLTTGDGLVFLPGARRVEAVDAASGVSRWRVPVDDAIAAPLLWHDHRLLAVTAHGSATMIRASTGEVLWTRLLGPSHIEPAAGSGFVYVALDDGRVVALAIESGATAWETKLPAPATTLASFGDRIYIGASDKFFYCLTASHGKTKWRWRTGAPAVGRVEVDAHHVYFAALDNVLRALNRGNGNQIWKAPLPHRPTGVFLTSRVLWVPGISGEMAAFQAFDGSAAGVSPLAGEPASVVEPGISAPGTFDGLFVVTGDGKAQWLVPGPPPLRWKAVPGLPAFTLPPDIKGYMPATGAP
jgi:outer membrane protein assembly factor BamB